MKVNESLRQLQFICEQASMSGQRADKVLSKVDEGVIHLLDHTGAYMLSDTISQDEVYNYNNKKDEFLNWLIELPEVQCPAGMKQVVANAILRRKGNAPVQSEELRRAVVNSTDIKNINKIYWQVQNGIMTEPPNKLSTLNKGINTDWRPSLVTVWYCDKDGEQYLNGLYTVQSPCYYTKDSIITNRKRVGELAGYVEYLFSMRNNKCIGIIKDSSFLEIDNKKTLNVTYGAKGVLGNALIRKGTSFKFKCNNERGIRLGTGNRYLEVEVSRKGETFKIFDSCNAEGDEELDKPIYEFMYAYIRTALMKRYTIIHSPNYTRIAYINEDGNVIEKTVFGM